MSFPASSNEHLQKIGSGLPCDDGNSPPRRPISLDMGPVFIPDMFLRDQAIVLFIALSQELFVGPFQKPATVLISGVLRIVS